MNVVKIDQRQELNLSEYSILIVSMPSENVENTKATLCSVVGKNTGGHGNWLVIDLLLLLWL